MKLFIKNMVCVGTKSILLKEMERIGIRFTLSDSGAIDFIKDLSCSEIKEIMRSLNEFGLEATFSSSGFSYKS